MTVDSNSIAGPRAGVAQRCLAEALGTALLLAAVVGSGVMAERRCDSAGLALACNALATGAALLALILAFGPISGAHFNPAVSLAAALRREIGPRAAAAYVLCQVAGALAGVILAHAMFELALVTASETERTGPGQWLSECVATAGLVLVLRLVSAQRRDMAALAVAAWISAAYWFTASTSFANPAATLARSLSDTFAGIRPADAPWFVLAELGGVLAAHLAIAFLAPASRGHSEPT